MSDMEHESVVRASFEQQTGLFTGEDSPFARQRHGRTSWGENLRPDMIVLDVACGAGHAAEEAAPHVRQVVGLDLTPALLTLAAERLGAAGVTNVLLQEGDATRLPFLDNTFDLVLCRSALHHFPHPEQPIAEMARVCRSGGRIVVTDMIVTSHDVRESFDRLHRLIDPSHCRAMLESELGALVPPGVGPVTGQDALDSITLPFTTILTEASDRVAALAMLLDELAGGPATGFFPVIETDQILVTFHAATFHADVQPA